MHDLRASRKPCRPQVLVEHSVDLIAQPDMQIHLRVLRLVMELLLGGSPEICGPSLRGLNAGSSFLDDPMT